VRPDHLFEGTQIDNIADMDRKGRRVNRYGDDHWTHRPETRDRVARGDRCGRSVLNEAAVREIRASSLPNRDLAAKFGCTATAVRFVRQRRVWRHLEGT
jgi:hypothetical protein